MFGISDKSFNLILSSIEEIEEIEVAAIYGSRAMGNFKNGSDIDIVIYGNSINQRTVLILKTKLEQELPIPYYFDITQYETIINMELKKHIDIYSKIFFKRKNTM